MSKPMKIISAVAGVLVLAAVVLTMFGKPPNLPIPGLQGMLAKEEEPAPVDATGVDPNAITPECTDGATTPDAGAGAVDPGAADPTATDPGAADPGAADPAAGGAPGVTDPTTGAPIASGGDGWTGEGRVLAAGEDDYDPGRVSDTVIVAAEAGAIDPTADPTAGAVDPAGAGAVDPAAGAGAGAVDPGATGAVDPAATGAGAVDPCADASGVGADPTAGGAGAVDPTTGAAGIDPGAGGGAGATGAAGTGAAGAATTTTTDGTNTGNSPEALRAAKDATTVMAKAKITVSTTATLVPSTGGIAKPAAMKRYRATVTGAVLVIKLDASAQEQWTSAGKKVQAQLVRSFMTRLAKSYARASRSITITDSSGTVLAIGDAAPRRAATVKLL